MKCYLKIKLFIPENAFQNIVLKMAAILTRPQYVYNTKYLLPLPLSPKLNADERLCLSCNVVENEEHFVTACKDNEVERELFTNKLEKETHHLQI